MRQKKLRVSDLSKSILSAFIGRSHYKKFGNDCLNNNEKLAIDIINLLDSMKNSIEKKMNMRFQYLQDATIGFVPNNPKGLIISLDKKKDSHKLVIVILCSSSRG